MKQLSKSDVSGPTKGLRHKKSILITLGVIVILIVGSAGIFFYYYFRTIYIENNYTKLGSNQVTFTINPGSVHPGESFSLTANFKKAYDFGNQGWYRYLSIVNSDNEDVLLTPSELLTNVGYVSTNPDKISYNNAITSAAAMINSRSGIFLESTYKQLKNRQNNPNSFYLEDIGCAVYLGPPTEPPKKYSDTLTFIVLPQTPPGDYTVSVKPGTYCNGLPASAESLQVTVLPVK
ncbi:MAG: hypothetical protein UY81_C0014G0006 [Candidatus Giovannonibacteria bacterium GW2011_GWA2_53_7]|uniref:Uncharacterized protein n=1 Tax=Candidatus Giovannonibacteria bacterium GW2011_GWA2_53_7 TaxID=1618650 RepID=A0A0G2AV65_9BACT|nr:MAG: hypothetical protein UY81_C0014G0006 [Candidatus Giovannonibacteria bacterium GW2011_GWA2_53_7]